MREPTNRPFATQDTSLVPGFSSQQVNGLMTLFSGMLDAKLDRRFGRFDETRQQSNPIPSIEYPPKDSTNDIEDEAFNRRTHRGQTAPTFTPPIAPSMVQPIRAIAEFKPQEVGFFHPSLTTSKEHPEGPYVNSGKDVIFRSVHMFVSQARRVAITKPGVSTNLHLCFRGSAMTWFATLDWLQQTELTNNLDAFLNRLIAKYKLSHSRAFDKMHSEHYTMDDVKNQRSADEYVRSLLFYGKDCDQSTMAVLTLAWKNLDMELQHDVPRPINGDSDEFVRHLDDAIDLWASQLSRRKPNQISQMGQTSQIGYTNHEEKEAAFQRGVRTTERRLLGQSQQKPQYPTYQSNGNYPRNPQQARLPPPQQRAITANHVDEDDEDNDDEVEHANFGWSEELYEQHQHELYFNDSEFERHGVSPYSCTVCGVSFDKTDDIEDHLLDDHGVDPRSPTSKNQLIYANRLEHAANHIVTIRQPPVGRGYATIQGRLHEDTKPETNLCVDTGSGTTFIDESLVPKGYDVLRSTRPITVRGLTGERIVDQSMDLAIHLHGTDGKHLLIKAKAYVTPGIRAGVILGMDELGRPEDDIALWLGRGMMQIQGTNIPINFMKPGSKPVAF